MRRVAMTETERWTKGGMVGDRVLLVVVVRGDLVVGGVPRKWTGRIALQWTRAALPRCDDRLSW